MIQSFIKIAWRNIVRNPFYSGINILGLAMGLAFTFCIMGYVWNEVHVNTDLKNADHQYIIQSKWADPNMGLELTTAGPLAKSLKERYPNLVANYYRFDGVTTNVSYGDKVFRESVQIGDSTFLNMYGWTVIDGNVATAMHDPFSVVITESKARKYFGKTNVAGELLAIQNFSGTKHDFVVSAVIKDLPDNSVTNITKTNDDIFVPSNNSKFFGRDMDQWANIYIVSYLELQKGVTPKDLELPIQQLVRQNTNETVSKNLKPYLLSLEAYHLQSNNGLVKKMLFTLSFVALFILLMAVINFVNISVSKSGTRMKEIGVRKVIGGGKGLLIRQFLIESCVLALCATVFALFIYQSVRPFFSGKMNITIPSLLSYPAWFIALPFVVAVIVGLIAGAYPAFVLAGLKPIDSLKGKFSSIKEKIWVRKSLVAFQFCVAATVLIIAVFIAQQINFFFNKSLGYNKEYMLSAQVPRDWTPEGVRKMERIRDEFAHLPVVQNVSLSYEIPNGNNSGSASPYLASADSTQAKTMKIFLADEKFADTYNIPLASGVFFAHEGSGYDSTKVVINEKAAKAFGWQTAAAAIGGQIRFPSDPKIYTVAGVVKDYHFGSKQVAIQPAMFLNVRLAPVYRFFSFKVKPGNIPSAIAAIEHKWKELLPDAAFEYSFMEDSLRAIYESELRLQNGAYAATLLTLVIVLLGVIGLVSLTVQKRTKEIGIRKVLGAPVASIITLFIREFLPLIAIAAVVACPVAFVLAKHWLNDYVYRINITALPFLLCVALLGVVTVLLIVGQTIKTAFANPVQSLRTE